MEREENSLAKSGNSISLSIYDLILGLMFACFTFILYKTIRSNDPDWNGTYIIFLAFLISIESTISKSIISKSDILNARPIISRISEWIVILVVVKASIYLYTGPNQFLIDIKIWQKDFSSFLLADGYILICFYLVFVWIISGVLSEMNNYFTLDPVRLDLERQGFVREERSNSRRKLMGWIFGMGSVMILLTTVANINLPFLSLHTDSIFQNLSAIMTFFILGFILLAKSQFSILRDQWFIGNITVNSKVSSRWISYGILLLTLISIIVIFLPTRYSLGILDVLRTIIGLIITALTLLGVLVFTPIAWLLSFISSLFGTTSGESSNIVPQATPIPTVTAPPPQVANSWLDLLRSVVFWVIFIVLILFAFRYYFRQRKGLFTKISLTPIKTWVEQSLRWFLKQFRRTGQLAAGIVNSGISQLKTILIPLFTAKSPLQEITALLPPRQQILLIYLSMLYWNNQMGLQRKGSQTPFEYSQVLGSSYPATLNWLQSLTGLFIEARYTNHKILPVQVIDAQTAVENIRTIILKAIDQKKGQDQTL
jgi:hypothetical protein